MDAQSNITVLSQQWKEIKTGVNITNVNYDVAEDLFSTVISQENLTKTISKENALLTLTSSLFQLEDIIKDFLNSEVKKKYSVLLEILDSVHTSDKIRYIGRDICFGFFDCTKQIDYVMNDLYKKTPTKSFAYPSSFYDASHLFDASQLLDDTRLLVDILEGMVDYWCGEQPSFAGSSDVSEVMHIGHSHQLSCAEVMMQPKLPIVSYEWRKNGYTIANEYSETLVIEGISAMDSGWYQCIASNGIGQAKSPIWTLTAVNKPIIVSNPVDTFTFEGNDNGAVFTCNASVQEGTVYWWYYSQLGGEKWDLISSDSNELVVENPLTSDEGWYRCHATSAGVTVVSEAAYLNILHASISDLHQELSFKIDVGLSELIEYDEEIDASIVDQLTAIFQPQYAQINIKNSSATEDALLVILQVRIHYNYIPSVHLSIQTEEAHGYKEDLVKLVDQLEAKIKSSELVFVFGGNSFHAIFNSVAVGEMQYACPPGSGLELNRFICSK